MDSSQKFIDLRLTLRRTPIPTVSDVLWDKRILYGKATELVRDEGFKKNQHFHLFALTEAGKETLKEP